MRASQRPLRDARCTCCGAVTGFPKVFLSQPGAAAGPGVPEAPASKIWSVARVVSPPAMFSTATWPGA